MARRLCEGTQVRWVVVLCVLASVAAAASEGQLVSLKHAPGGKLHVPSGANGVHPLLSQVVSDRRRLSETTAPTGVQVLVTVDTPVDADLEAALVAAAGSRPAFFLPERTYGFWLKELTSVDLLAAVEHVSRVDHMLPEYKASANLASNALALGGDADSAQTKLSITVVHSFDESAQGRATRAEALAALRTRMASELPAAKLLGGAQASAPVVLTTTADLESTTQWLARQEEVHSVGLTGVRKLRNKEAAWITQSGDMETRATPVWDHGLTGEGQLVGVSDSGFDTSNCLLTNDFANYPGYGSMVLCQDCTAANTESRTAADGTITCGFTSPECTTVSDGRKVAAYLAYSDGVDGGEEGGHGTHCAGTIVGYSTVASTVAGEEINDFKGMAPNARIVAVDDQNLDDGNPTMMFDFTLSMGAKVHSASWGSNGWEGSATEGYNEAAAAFDAHTLENPESLIVIAAGNDGEKYGYGASLDPEAHVKNVVAVGATRTSYAALADWQWYNQETTWSREFVNDDGTSVEPFSSRGPAWDGRIKPDVLAPGWTLSAKSMQTQAGWSEMHCSRSQSTGYMKGTSMATPVVAGSVALMREYLARGMHACGADTATSAYDTPSAALMKAMLISSARRPTTSFTMPDPLDTHGECQTVEWEARGFASADAFCATKYDATATCADFSSEWQTQGGRSIFCPYGGSVDDGGCHHYVFCCACNGVFCDKNACNVGQYAPPPPVDDYTGRRLLEHDSDYDAENDLTSTHIELGSSHLHMGITGHGQIHLDNTLMFEGSNTILHTVDDATLAQGEQHLYPFEVVAPSSGDSWVRVTLVWSDPAASPTVAQGDALVNNLDLDVSFTADYPTVEATDADSIMYKGNAFYGMPDYTTSADGYDKINNVEVVHIPGALSGWYTVRVKGTTVVQPLGGSQKYSLVVNYVHAESASCTTGATFPPVLTPVDSFSPPATMSPPPATSASPPPLENDSDLTTTAIPSPPPAGSASTWAHQGTAMLAAALVALALIF